MAAVTESMPISPFQTSPTTKAGIHRNIPILSTSSPLSRAMAAAPAPISSSTIMVSAPEAMDLSPTSKMGPPPTVNSPSVEKGNPLDHINSNESTDSNGAQAVGAAAVATQPKVVQTAFIHKLYNMLEDRSIAHLISWSSTNESFVMSPSTEFSKVLSSYFKHTNISSFVRQLNMYGFHKVSDVFHTGQPDSPLWEFKHGNGSFKRGDLVGLREIKRRASRHALIHRDSFSGGSSVQKPTMPPTVETPMDSTPHTLEGRLSMLEHNYYDMQSRMGRLENENSYLTNKCGALMDGLVKCHQWNQDLATWVMSLVPETDGQVIKDVAMMQRDIARQVDMLRNYDEPHSAPPMSARDPYFSTLNDQITPLSPRQMPQMDRRPSQPSLMVDPRGSFRPPIAPHLTAVSPRRYGSIGSQNGYSPSTARAPSHNIAPPPPPVQMQHPLATVSSPPMNLSRRHTSADIRINAWENGIPQNISPNEMVRTPGQPSPYASGNNSSAWPSSPARNPFGASNGHRESNALQEQLGSYDLHRASRSRPPISPSLGPGDGSNGAPNGGPTSAGMAPESAWQLPGARFSPFKTPNFDPFARRGSTQSNLHSLLNHSSNGVGSDEDVGPDGANKRKRM